jgi:hypothetical protein
MYDLARAGSHWRLVSWMSDCIFAHKGRWQRVPEAGLNFLALHMTTAFAGFKLS